MLPQDDQAWLYPELHSDHKDGKQWVGMTTQGDGTEVQTPLLRGRIDKPQGEETTRADSSPWDLCLATPSLSGPTRTWLQTC